MARLCCALVKVKVKIEAAAEPARECEMQAPLTEPSAWLPQLKGWSAAAVA